jgi:hypothetical protein
MPARALYHCSLKVTKRSRTQTIKFMREVRAVFNSPEHPVPGSCFVFSRMTVSEQSRASLPREVNKGMPLSSMPMPVQKMRTNSQNSRTM